MMKIEKQQNATLLIIRLLVGILLIFHGLGNFLSGYAFIGGVLESTGLPKFFSYGAFVGEIVAPLFIILGYRARLASLAVMFTMLMAVVLVHTGDIFALNKFGGWAIELQAFYLFGALALFFSGAGSYAISQTNEWD